MIRFLDVALPDPVENTSNVGIFVIIGLSVLLVIAVIAALIFMKKNKNK